MSGRISKGWYWTTVLLGALFLIQYWIEFLSNLESGNIAGYKNYWGADVGVYLLLAVLLILTPTLFYLAWKHFPKSNNKVTKDES
jgi:hypothetical protein